MCSPYRTIVRGFFVLKILLVHGASRASSSPTISQLGKVLLGASARSAPLTAAEWRALLDAGSGRLSYEERRIVDLLAQGKSQTAVGERLGMNRSLVWRKAKEIAARHRPAV